MATITIVLPDATNTDLITAVCANHGYQANLPNPAPQFIDGVAVDGWTPTITNPEAPGQFTIAQLIQWGSDHITAYTKAQAIAAAAASIVPPDASQITVTVT